MEEGLLCDRGHVVLGVFPQGILPAAPHHGSPPLHPIGSIGLSPGALALPQDAEGSEEACRVYMQDIRHPEGGCYPIQ